MAIQIIDKDPGHPQRAACLALVLAAIVLLTPGPVIGVILSLLEPAIDALRDWKNSWWPWPVSDPAGATVGIDKVIHALLFLTCSVLANKAWVNTLNNFVIFLLLLCFAGMTELLQHYIPGRGMSLGDIAADAVGILAGMAIWQTYRYTTR
jgi:VanZ family protein